MLDAVITAYDSDYAVRMSYPSVYPSLAPAVSPAAKERWSPHQYGNGGTLCLEYSGDTWSSELTGADMLESTYRLLELENPKGTGGIPAPTRHTLSQGQEARANGLRLLVRPELLAVLKQAPQRHSKFERANIWQQDAIVTFIAKVFTRENEIWRDASIPTGIKTTQDSSGLIVKTDCPREVLQAIASLDDLNAILGVTIDTLSTFNDLLAFYYPDSPSDSLISLLFLAEDDTTVTLSVLLKSDDVSVYKGAVVEPEPINHQRKPKNLTALAGKQVGIVGLGSVGSKIAVSLARLGVKRFYLLDEDILLPENLSRHALDFQAVGQHKTRATMKALERLVPDLEIVTSEMNLTGQENNALLSRAMESLGECDLIVDATASPGVFALLSEVALTYRKPIVWGKVFAGGIGGLVARSRPDLDPNPTKLNSAYLSYTHANPFEAGNAEVDYGAQLGDGIVVAAADPEVSIIAHQLALLAADTLSDVESERFPYPMYLLGLGREWVFEEPFHTIPIIPEDPLPEWDYASAEADRQEALRLLLNLITPKSEEVG